MKDNKNTNFFRNPLFSKGNIGRMTSGSTTNQPSDVLQEYTLFQFFMLKFKTTTLIALKKLKQNVLFHAKIALRSTLFWKSLTFLVVFGWFYNFTKDVQVRFHSPITITKGNLPQGAPMQEMNLLGMFTGNDAAPSSLSDLQQKKTEAYIRQYAKVAIAEHRKYGIPASIKMAQAIVESRAGESPLAQKNANHFGMKCFSKKCKGGHCTNLTDDSHKDFFRKYNSAWESWRAHSVLLKSKRYQPLQKLGDDYKAWAKGLKQLGYATDPNYDKKIIAIIEAFQLYRLDQQ